MKLVKTNPNGLKHLYLFRYLYHPEGTFGTLVHEYPICQTVERYWRLNKKDVSCIPAGTYKCEKSEFTRRDGSKYPCLEVMDVPGNRTDIKMHIANDPILDLTGCVAPGVENGRSKTYMGVLRSTEALERVMAIVGEDDEIMLTIVDCVGHEFNIKAAMDKLKLVGSNLKKRKVASVNVPEVVMEKIDEDPNSPDIKFSFFEKIVIGWWTIKPYLTSALKAGGKIIAPVNPLLGASILIAGEIIGKLKGNKEVERRTKLNAWNRFIDAVMSWAKEQKKKEK